MGSFVIIALTLLCLAGEMTAQEIADLDREKARITKPLKDWATENRNDAWDMDNAGDAVSCTNIKKVTFKDGMMSFATKRGGHFFLNLNGKNIDASYDVLVVRMYSSRAGWGKVFYWSPNGDWRGFIFPGVRKGWHTYCLDMKKARVTIEGSGSKKSKQWGGATGVISKFRFDPIKRSGVEVKIDWVKLLKVTDDKTRKHLVRLQMESIRESMRKKHYKYFGGITRRSFPTVSLDLLPKPLFSFIAIADTHLGAEGEEDWCCHPGRVLEAVRQINQFKPPFVVLCGDIITAFPQVPHFEAQLDNALKFFRQNLKVPIHYVAGNHDVGDKVSFKKPKPSSHHSVCKEGLDAYRKRFGKDYYSFDHKDCHFIVLNNEVFNSGLPTEAKQWEWFKKDLEKSKDSRFKFIFYHNVLFWAGVDDPGPGCYETVDEPMRSEFLELCKKYDVKAVYSGHTHWSFHNTVGNTELHTLYGAAFPRPFLTKKLLGGAALYDPHKVGYYVVRVYPEDIVTQFVQTYPRTPEPAELQKANKNPRLRILTRSASEITDNLLGVVAKAPEVVVRARVQRGRYVVDQAVTLPGQIGVKWLKIKQPFEMGGDSHEISAELKRLITLGKPKGVNLVLPLRFAGDKRDWAALSECKGKIAAWEILNSDQQGKRLPVDKYAKLVEQAAKELKKLDPKAKLVAGEVALSDSKLLDEYIAGGVLANADAIALRVDLSKLGGEKYMAAIASLQKKLNTSCPKTEIWIHFASSSNKNKKLAGLAFTKSFIGLLLFNQRAAVRSFIDSTGESCSLLDEDLDPTSLYYAAMTFSAVFDAKSVSLAKPPPAITVSSEEIKKRFYHDGEGNLYLALWAPEGKAEVAADIIVEGKIKGKAFVIDPITSTLQELKYQLEGDKIHIPGVIVQGYPIFIKMAVASGINVLKSNLNGK